MPTTTTKERPAQFAADEIEAFAAQRKTQFRIPIVPQPTTVMALEGRRLAMRLDPMNGRHVLTFADASLVPAMQAGYGWIAPAFGRCPFGNPGDVLWVQEDWWSDRREPGVVIYDATPEIGKYENRPGEVIRSTSPDGYQPTRDECRAAMLPKFWTKQPARKMPRWASRFTLEIKEIQVQQLQGISRDEAFLEGIEAVNPYDTTPNLPPGMPACFKDYSAEGGWFAADPIASFRSRWIRAHPKLVAHPSLSAWNLNEWVWVFTVIQINRQTMVK